MLFLELALSYRSGNAPWMGMQKLTREADAKTHWRVFSVLSVLMSVLLAVGFLVRFAERLTGSVMSDMGVPSYALAFVLTFAALILSPIKGRLLGPSAVLIVVSALLSPLLGGWDGIAMTQTSIAEWARAVVMALFSMGVGTGLYWFLDDREDTHKKRFALTTKVLPIWLTQVAFGAIAFGVAGTPHSSVASVIGTVGVVMVASFLLGYAREQLATRFGVMKGTLMAASVALLLAALPSGVIGASLATLGLLTALVLALFAGFVMKISHLRKSLNFKTEVRYGLWRVMVRWLVPLAIVLAVVGWFL